jgi:hypothetical protein
MAVRIVPHFLQRHVLQFNAHMVEIAYPEFAAPELRLGKLFRRHL